MRPCVAHFLTPSNRIAISVNGHNGSSLRVYDCIIADLSSTTTDSLVRGAIVLNAATTGDIEVIGNIIDGYDTPNSTGETMLAVMPKRTTDKAIAQRVGVSQSFVATVRDKSMVDSSPQGGNGKSKQKNYARIENKLLADRDVEGCASVVQRAGISWRQFKPSALRENFLTPGGDLKPSLVNSSYAGGAPASAADLKASVVDHSTGFLNRGLVYKGSLKPAVRAA